MQPRAGLGCSISVISLQKLKTFLEQPKYNHARLPCSNPPVLQHHPLPYQHHDSRHIEDSLPPLGNVDTSQQLPPGLFSNHDSGTRVPPSVNSVGPNHVPPGGGPPPSMGQPGPPQGVANSKKSGMLGPMGPPVSNDGTMSLAPPTKMSPPPHQNPNDVNPSANGNTGRKYQCKMCPQIFGSKADLQLHTQIHMRDAKPYKCSQCSKTFANSSYLSQHTRIHLGIKPYRCEICHRKFTQLSHLQQHIRTHTGDKPYKCRYPNCNKAFSQLSNLQSHSRCHQTDKPYKCNSCYKCFSDEASLLEHIPKHKESKHLKTHICQFCGKSYTQETYLAKHMQKHADRMEKHGLMMGGGNSGGHTGNHHGHHSLMLGSSMGGPGNQMQPDMLWQKALQAKVVENVVSMSEEGPNSSVAAMAAVVASQRRSMDSCLPSLGSLNSRDMDNRQDSRMSMSCNDQENMGGPQQQNQQHQQQPPPSSQSMFDSPMSTTAGMTNSSNSGGKSTSSAFTPIQAGLLPMGNQLNIVSSPRTYFSYDSINFGKGVETAKNTASFPNQLISLRQIKSYASMPTMATGMDHPISLKGKGPN